MAEAKYVEYIKGETTSKNIINELLEKIVVTESEITESESMDSPQQELKGSGTLKTRKSLASSNIIRKKKKPGIVNFFLQNFFEF